MKGFEKWWSDNENAIFRTDISTAVEVGWRAALQWVLDDLDYSIEHKEIGDKLDKELSDK